MYNVPTAPSRAIAVVLSDTNNIPFPNLVVQGTNTGVQTPALVDTGVNFNTLGVKVGDTVKNVNADTIANVVSVFPNGTKLLLDQGIFTATPQDYEIYQGDNRGCMIYVGAAGDVAVLTADNDSVIFYNVQDGYVLPVKVLRVLATGTTALNMVAFW